MESDCFEVNLSSSGGPAALTYHYETQCIPTPLAWFAHQLPVWWQKLSVVGTFVIEILVPPLFFSPLRRLRLGAFYMQVSKISCRSYLLFPQTVFFFFLFHGLWSYIKKFLLSAAVRRVISKRQSFLDLFSL